VKKLSRSLSVAVLIAFAAVPILAQPEKVSIRMAPRPGQTVRLTMTQEMDMKMSADGVQAFPGMQMMMRSSMVLTQKTGAVKPDGTVDAEVTYDDIRTEMSINGQSSPAANAAVSSLLGKTVTITYSRDGEVVDVKGLPDPAGIAEAVKQTMMSMLGNVPVTALAVGESATMPLTMTLPLPLPGADAMQMTGETKLTLLSIDNDGQGRSARFVSTTNGNMRAGFPSPDGKNAAALDFTTTGEGTSVLDLDKGIIRSAVTTATMGGKVNMSGAAAGAQPAMTIVGTTRVTVTSGN
jgi:hypothetical protein